MQAMKFCVFLQNSDLVKFDMCTRLHMTFYILKKGYIVPGNQGTHDKLNQIRNILCKQALIFG